MKHSLLSNTKTYLGAILDSKMSWIQHIAYVKNKVAKGIGIMFKLKQDAISIGEVLSKCATLKYTPT